MFSRYIGINGDCFRYMPRCRSSVCIGSLSSMEGTPDVVEEYGFNFKQGTFRKDEFIQTFLSCVSSRTLSIMETSLYEQLDITDKCCVEVDLSEERI